MTVYVKIQNSMLIFPGSAYDDNRYRAIEQMIETRILHRVMIKLTERKTLMLWRL